MKMVSTFSKIFATILIMGFALQTGCGIDEEKISVFNPPEDKTIPDYLLAGFVQKSFVNLLGREPSANEESKFTAKLKSEYFSAQSRKDVVEAIMKFPEYNDNIYKTTREYLLNFIFHPSFLDTTLEIWKKLPPSLEKEEEIARLKKLKSIPDDLKSGSLNTMGLQRRLAHNSFYDFVNMGTENFVVSVFENFLLRFPTEFEKSQGKKMVDGEAAVLFGKKGNSKTSFLDIIFSNPSYHEGQVRLLFRQYLFREPASAELATLSLKFMEKIDFQSLVKEILAGEEFSGLSPKKISVSNEKN